jgi:ankyrin repeat protein
MTEDSDSSQSSLSEEEVVRKASKKKSSVFKTRSPTKKKKGKKEETDLRSSIKKKKKKKKKSSSSVKKKKKKERGKEEEEKYMNSDDENSSTNGEENEEVDHEKLLAELEFSDFSLSDGEEQATLINGNIDWDSINWNRRMKREEIFSKRYKPSKYERKELETVAKELGVQSKSNLIGMIQCGMGTKVNEDLEQVLFGKHAILVRRGHLQWQNEECELILLTDGFILKYRNISYFNPMAKKLETCHLWTEVDFCEISEDSSIVIHLTSGNQWEFQAAEDGYDVNQWLWALERVIVEHAINNPACSKITEVLGWQYRLIHRPGYSSAVTGSMELMGDALVNINDLDKYKEYAPLHYALQQEPCNIAVIACLLDAGASPNLPDGEGQSPMYYAEKNSLDDVKKLLESRGGKKSKMTEAEEVSYFFQESWSAHFDTPSATCFNQRFVFLERRAIWKDCRIRRKHREAPRKRTDNGRE